MLGSAIASLLSDAKAMQATAPRHAAQQNDPLSIFDAVVTHPRVVSVSRRLFKNEHHTQAVEQAFKALMAYVRSKSGLQEDGVALMQRAFSMENPKLRITPMRNRTEKDQQFGMMSLMVCAIAAIRNPHAHDPDQVDGSEIAIQQLALADYLFKCVDAAEVVASVSE